MKNQLILLFLVGLLTLSGCGGNDSAAQNGNAGAETAPSAESDEQVETRAAPAPNAGPADAPAVGGELAYIDDLVGKRPAEVNLWQSEPLQARLKKLLGNNFETYVQLMQEAGPLTRDRVIYTLGTAPDDQIPGVAYLLVDTGADRIKAYAVYGDLVIDAQSPGDAFYIPHPVTNRLSELIKE
jgi:hypothetical protein